MYNIIKRPVVTEKSTNRAQLYNEYTFQVDKKANRTEIRKAVEKLFNVKVERVNTLILRKESMKLGKFPGERKLWKKAIVKLKEGDKLDFVAS